MAIENVYLIRRTAVACFDSNVWSWSYLVPFPVFPDPSEGGWKWMVYNGSLILVTLMWYMKHMLEFVACGCNLNKGGHNLAYTKRCYINPFH